VIFLTARTETDDLTRGFDVGAVDYVTKPIQPQEVFARVKAHLHNALLQQQLAERNQQLQQEIEERARVEEVLAEDRNLLQTAGFAFPALC
jgi:DNA-binding response OmpR family regulator